MIRLSMLQLRVQAITAAVALIAFTVLLAATEPQLASLYAASGLRRCQPAGCGQLADSFLQQVNSTGPYGPVYQLSIILIVPASHTTVAINFNDSTLNLYTTNTPHTFTFSLAADDGLPGQPEAWIRSSGAADAAGHPVSTVVPSACSPLASSSGPGPALANCLTSRGIRIAVAYQPASRYWPLQWTETGIYLALSLALAGYCFRRLSRLS